MGNITEHYEGLLAEHYSWMFGVSPAVKAAEQRDLLIRMGLGRGELAVDLGAGSGFQSMALADMGFTRILAMDTSAKLLAELGSNCGDRPVEPIHDDMMHIAQHVNPGAADVVVCMGDTVTHLPAREEVSRLFSAVCNVLRPGGQFVVTFRDLSLELRGLERFIPVRSTPDKIMTCFLEYGPDVVNVHDLIHIREGESWKLLKSSYAKLRLPVSDISLSLEGAGFEVYAQESIRAMSVIAARRRSNVSGKL